MSNSHVQPLHLVCPHCSNAVTLELWLVIDAAARPDLLARVQAGTVHDLPCPVCGRVAASVEAPLLLYRPEAAVRLVFSPAPETPPEKMADQSAALLGVLRRRLGDGFQESWVREAMASALQSALPSILDDLDQEDADAADPEGGRRRRAYSAALGRLHAARTVADADAVLAAHPELLVPETTAVLERVAELHRQRGDDARARTVQDTLNLVRIQMLAVGPAMNVFGGAVGDDEILSGILGELFTRQVRQDPARAVELCRAALARVDRGEAPALWALLQATLGNRLAELTDEDRPAHLEQAIAAYRQALEVYRPEGALGDWVGVQISLANALQERLLGDRAQNFEDALEICRQLAAVATREDHPADWAHVMDVTGSVYTDRIRGERADNLERAVEAYQQALGARTPEQNLDGWIVSTNNLARAYSLRLHGDRAANLDRAIELYEDVISRLDPQAPAAEDDWALAQDNLAAAYADRVNGDPEENLERSIAAYEQALRVRTRERQPYAWAWTTANLGASYAQRRRGVRADNLERAIALFEAALRVLTREDAPARWAGVLVNLGTALYERERGEPADNLRRSAEALSTALEVFTPDTVPMEARRTAFKLGAIRQVQGDLPGAYDAFAVGARAAEALYRSAYVPAGQQVEIQINADLYERLVATCVELRRVPDFARRALVHAEEAKARTFLAQMGQADFRIPDGTPAHTRETEAGLIERLRELNQALSGAGPAVAQRDLAEERAAVTARLEAIWDDIGRLGREGREYAALRRGTTPTWEDLRSLADRLGPDVGLVQFYLLEDAIAVFCLRAGMEAPVVLAAPVSRQALLDRYLTVYEREILRFYDAPGGSRTHAWMTLGDALLAPVLPWLEGVRLVYFIPHGWLHTVPIHALTVEGEPFIARCAVAYAASAGVLTRVLDVERAPAPGPAVVVGFTPNDDPVERYLFLSEAQEVAERFDATPIIDDAATADSLRGGAAGWLMHLSCHGYFDRDDPLASGVLLRDGVFTASEWMGLRLGAELLVLSACESGFSRIGRGDEIASLSRALLQAGASSALLTLWTVNAQSTKEWMLEFYDAGWDSGRRPRRSKAEAFRQATLTMRARYPDPLYWAPFALMGHWE